MDTNRMQCILLSFAVGGFYHSCKYRISTTTKVFLALSSHLHVPHVQLALQAGTCHCGAPQGREHVLLVLLVRTLHMRSPMTYLDGQLVNSGTCSDNLAC
jgi:hypothetical protein